MSTNFGGRTAGLARPRRRLARCWTLPLALAPSACVASREMGEPTGELRGPDVELTVVSGGTIYVDSQRTVEALLVEEGLVLAAGTEQEIAERSRQAMRRASHGVHVRYLHLDGATAVPGLQDAHGHIESLGETLERLDLTALSSFDELVARARSQAERQPAGSWILGRGWDHTRWGSEFPRHEALSAAVPDHPVFLRRVDGHAALANARALELAGLLGSSALPAVPTVEGGRIVVGEDGLPTGVLVDAAMDLVSSRIPPPERADTKRRILAAQEKLLACGLTTVHDMGLRTQSAEAFEELDRDGELRLRVIGYLWANEGPERTLSGAAGAEIVPLGTGGTRYPGPRDLDPGSRLRMLGAKLMVDGALGSRGAALLEPYADAPGESGLLQLTPEVFAERLRAVLEAGLQPATHAIGDRGNRLVLDAYERELARDPRLAALRPRVEHAQIVAREDWPRFEALGVVPSMQPTHATSDMRWAEARVGPERIAGGYAWKRLAGPHAPLACGSDFPVESTSPLLGLYAARTRTDERGEPPGGWLPDQALSGAEALAGFTSGAAYAAREEERRGKLLPGHAADITVLDVDPVRCEPSALLRARVLRTVIDGTIVYEDKESEP